MLSAKKTERMKFFKHGTRRVIGPFMLRLSDCYAELGGAWDAVERLDRKLINQCEENVRLYGKFGKVFHIVK